MSDSLEWSKLHTRTEGDKYVVMFRCSGTEWPYSLHDTLEGARKAAEMYAARADFYLGDLHGVLTENGSDDNPWGTDVISVAIVTFDDGMACEYKVPFSVEEFEDEQPEVDPDVHVSSLDM
jgi:hypothetical protein